MIGKTAHSQNRFDLMRSNDIKMGYLNNPSLMLEIIEFLCGELIGVGCFRDVFQDRLNDDYVVKIENRDGNGDNFAEWRVWNAVQETEHVKWFAECGWISPNGLVLIQKKTAPIESKSEKRIPDRLPSFFTDVKPDNFGWIGNQLVCHDYSHCIEKFSYYALTKRTQKTEGLLK